MLALRALQASRMTARSMSAAVHFLLLNGLVNKRTADRCTVHLIEVQRLVDCHRSPVSVMFEKQSGSPTWIRTCVTASKPSPASATKASQCRAELCPNGSSISARLGTLQPSRSLLLSFPPKTAIQNLR
jgi:hypothetical protein